MESIQAPVKRALLKTLQTESYEQISLGSNIPQSTLWRFATQGHCKLETRNLIPLATYLGIELMDKPIRVPADNICTRIGDVINKDPNLQPNCKWSLGRIFETAYKEMVNSDKRYNGKGTGF